MSKKVIVILCTMFVAGYLVFSTESQAMPNFARKYNADCTMCHTQIPKLNKLGYEFRLAGFRLPSEIGKDEKPFNLAEFFTARLQEQYTWKQHSDVTSSKSFTSSQLEFHEFTFYPLTGSWGKNFASLVELSMAPGDVFEVENAYVRGVYGDDNGWFQAKLGVMHPWEGFGASDRPIGNIRPVFQKNAAVGSPFFLWNLDESALEVGYHLAKTGTTINARLSNGIIWKTASTSIGSSANPTHADPAQGGEFAKTKNDPGWNDKSYQLFLNQFINNDSSVTLYYYHGSIPFPDTTTDPPPAAITRDTFQRFAAYANYLIINKVNLLAGYEYGHDSLGDNTVAGGSKVGNSHGYFGEVDFHATPKLAFAGRYDYFDPSNNVSNNEVSAYTLSGNYYLFYGLQFIADYQHKETKQTAGGKNKDDQFVARLIFIW